MPTVSALLANGSAVLARCQECGWSQPVDLEKLLAEAGDIDLTGRHPPCRRCDYWVGFYATDGQRTRALATWAGENAESDRRTAWLFRRRPATGGRACSTSALSIYDIGTPAPPGGWGGHG